MLWQEKMIKFDVACNVRDGRTSPTAAAAWLGMTLDEFAAYYRSRFGALA